MSYFGGTFDPSQLGPPEDERSPFVPGLGPASPYEDLYAAYVRQEWQPPMGSMFSDARRQMSRAARAKTRPRGGGAGTSTGPLQSTSSPYGGAPPGYPPTGYPPPGYPQQNPYGGDPYGGGDPYAAQLQQQMAMQQYQQQLQQQMAMQQYQQQLAMQQMPAMLPNPTPLVDPLMDPYEQQFRQQAATYAAQEWEPGTGTDPYEQAQSALLNGCAMDLEGNGVGTGIGIGMFGEE